MTKDLIFSNWKRKNLISIFYCYDFFQAEEEKKREIVNFLINFWKKICYSTMLSQNNGMKKKLIPRKVQFFSILKDLLGFDPMTNFKVLQTKQISTLAHPFCLIWNGSGNRKLLISRLKFRIIHFQKNMRTSSFWYYELS